MSIIVWHTILRVGSGIKLKPVKTVFQMYEIGEMENLIQADVPHLHYMLYVLCWTLNFSQKLSWSK